MDDDRPQRATFLAFMQGLVSQGRCLAGWPSSGVDQFTWTRQRPLEDSKGDQFWGASESRVTSAMDAAERGMATFAGITYSPCTSYLHHRATTLTIIRTPHHANSRRLRAPASFTLCAGSSDPGILLQGRPGPSTSVLQGSGLLAGPLQQMFSSGGAPGAFLLQVGPLQANDVALPADGGAEALPLEPAEAGPLHGHLAPALARLQVQAQAGLLHLPAQAGQLQLVQLQALHLAVHHAGPPIHLSAKQRPETKA